MTTICTSCDALMAVGSTYHMSISGTRITCPSCHQLEKKPGYHIREIKKGVLGEASKVMEECEEFMDAVEQDVDIMALVELSDLLGAISAYLDKHHPSITMDDLHKMRETTERAFKNGRRN